MYSIFIRKKSSMEIQGEPLSQECLHFPGQSTWTSCNRTFKLFVFYSYISDLKRIHCSSWTSCCFHLQLLSCIFFFNLSHKNFWTFSIRVLELLATKLLAFAFSFFFSYKCTTCSTWTSDSFQSKFVLVTWKYLSFWWILIRIS